MGWIGAAGAFGRVTMPLLRNLCHRLPELAVYRGAIMFALGGLLLATACVVVLTLCSRSMRPLAAASEFYDGKEAGETTDRDEGTTTAGDEDFAVLAREMRANQQQRDARTLPSRPAADHPARRSTIKAAGYGAAPRSDRF